MSGFGFLLVALLIFGSASVTLWAADKPWNERLEASLVSTNGNSKATTYGVKNIFDYSWSKTKLELEGAALSSESNGDTTAEAYYGSEKAAYTLSERNYTYEKFRWDKDRFAGIDQRYDSSVGLGRQFIKAPKDNLLGELGGGYVDEKRTVPPDNSFASGRAYSKYVHTMSPTSSFTQDAEYIHNFENSDDFRVNTETSLLSAISVHLSLKLSYRWKYVGQPPAGFGRSDTITTMSIVAIY